MQIVVINGMPRAGKDQFVQFCQEHMAWCKNISTVDFVKQVANFCGWDGTKTPKNRAFLSDLKDLLTKWDDVPFKKVKSVAENYNSELISYNFDTLIGNFLRNAFKVFTIVNFAQNSFLIFKKPYLSFKVNYS